MTPACPASLDQSREVASSCLSSLGLLQYCQVLSQPPQTSITSPGAVWGPERGEQEEGLHGRVPGDSPLPSLPPASPQTGSPSLVLMDEPTSGLDPGSKRKV